jgi:hypothetical protein
MARGVRKAHKREKSFTGGKNQRGLAIALIADARIRR